MPGDGVEQTGPPENLKRRRSHEALPKVRQSLGCRCSFGPPPAHGTLFWDAVWERVGVDCPKHLACFVPSIDEMAVGDISAEVSAVDKAGDDGTVVQSNTVMDNHGSNH